MKKLTNIFTLLMASGAKPFDNKGRYLHWEKLKHLTLPEGCTAEQHWFAVRMAREKLHQEFPFVDTTGKKFVYCQAGPIVNDLLWISEHAKGAVAADPKITDPKTRDTYLISSLIEESINSSQLEGASTTNRVAKEMIRTAREPKDKSEQMILNNYQAMLFIKDNISEELTTSMVFELHRILTEKTFEAGFEHKAGAFRSIEDDIAVCDDMTGEVLHRPPPAGNLPERLQVICDFANSKIGDPTIPPLIRSIVVHFMVGYDHPFFDGNGRTARALFYWVVMKEGFWLLEHVSISGIIKAAQPSYIKAYLHTETDGGDVTYFIVHQMDVVRKAIERLHEYLTRKTQELRDTEAALHDSELRGQLNHRQLALIKHAMRNPGAQYTVRSHQASHGVTNQTARTDLCLLSDNYGLLVRTKQRRTDVFIAPIDIGDRINRARAKRRIRKKPA
jgi:Fic family protein